MRQPLCSLVRYDFLELRRLMLAGRPWLGQACLRTGGPKHYLYPFLFLI